MAVTPDMECLESVTRQCAIDSCKELGIPREVRQVSADELMNVDEAFLTSSAGGVMSISSVNNKILRGNASPSEITMRLHDAYWEKRWAGWDGAPFRYE